MSRASPRAAWMGALVLVLSLFLFFELSLGDLAIAKKKGGGTAQITKQVNLPVPDATATTNGLLASTIHVGGKRFKGTVIRDVNVTLQTTGLSAQSAGQIDARLTAPNGMTTWLLGNNLAEQSIGPLTLDDESPNYLGGTAGRDPTDLVSPYIGTAQPDCFSAPGVCTLWPMDGGPASGTWTLRVYDVDDSAVATSILNFWRLRVVAGRPYRAR
jgi:subtilisin-like proprotein convertase family protein